MCCCIEKQNLTVMLLWEKLKMWNIYPLEGDFPIISSWEEAKLKVYLVIETELAHCQEAFVTDFYKVVFKNWYLGEITLHEKWSFLLRISSVNVTKLAVSCGFGHIYWRNP